MWFGPTYGNCCAGDRRLRRMQGAGAGPRAAEGKPLPRGADRCGVPAPGTARARRPAYRRAKTLLRSVFRAREILRTGHRSLLPQLRLGGYFYASVRELLRRRPPPAADAGSRSRAAGRRGQAPPHGALTDAGYPRPVQGGAPQCATNSPVDCSLARGRFPYHQGKYLPALFYPLQFVLLGNQPFEFFFQFLFILAVGGGQP